MIYLAKFDNGKESDVSFHYPPSDGDILGSYVIKRTREFDMRYDIESDRLIAVPIIQLVDLVDEGEVKDA